MDDEAFKESVRLRNTDTVTAKLIRELPIRRSELLAAPKTVDETNTDKPRNKAIQSTN
jgi:hypothetical protein